MLIFGLWNFYTVYYHHRHHCRYNGFGRFAVWYTYWFRKTVYVCCCCFFCSVLCGMGSIPKSGILFIGSYHPNSVMFSFRYLWTKFHVSRFHRLTNFHSVRRSKKYEMFSWSFRSPKFLWIFNWVVIFWTYHGWIIKFLSSTFLAPFFWLELNFRTRLLCTLCHFLPETLFEIKRGSIEKKFGFQTHIVLSQCTIQFWPYTYVSNQLLLCN